MKRLAILPLMAIFGCGESPIFNHTQKHEPPAREAQPTPAPSAAGPVSSQKESRVCDIKFEKSGLCTTLKWLRGPSESEGEEGDALRMDFWEVTSEQARDIKEGDLSVKLWMPSMGHGSQKVKIERFLDEAKRPVQGGYMVTKIFFIMGGHWELWVTIKDSAGKDEKGKIDFTI